MSRTIIRARRDAYRGFAKLRRLPMLLDQANDLLKAAAAIGKEFEAGPCERVLGGSGDLVNLLRDEASSGGTAK